MVFSRPVCVYDCGNNVIWYIVKIRAKLLCVFWQTVAAIAKRRIVVVRTDSRVKPYALNNLLRVKSAHLRISVKFVKIRYAKRKVRVGKQLDGLRLRRPRKKRRNVLFDCAFL